ncbi:Ribonuclease P protein subunit p20, partial [Trichinella pseudospiralis]
LEVRENRRATESLRITGLHNNGYICTFTIKIQVMEGVVTNNNAVLTVKHEIHRRKPPRLSNRKNDIYVTEKTHIKDTGYKAVYIHAMGEAMNRAISLALQLKRQGRGSLNVDVCTSSVNLIDDLEPVVDDAKVEKRTRTTSAIHIKLFKCEVAVDDY